MLGTGEGTRRCHSDSKGDKKCADHEEAVVAAVALLTAVAVALALNAAVLFALAIAYK